MSMSLINLLKNDDGFQRRLAARVNEVKEDKSKILSCAESYSEKYKKEIEEGERLRQNLLTEGSAKGLSEEQVLVNYGRFVPAKRTPLLNMLYFLLRESENDPYTANQRARANQIDEYLKSKYKTEADINEDDPELLATVSELYNETKSHSYREQFNEEIDIEHHQTSKVNSPGDAKEIEDISEYLYGSVTLEIMSKLKKLKALAQSENIEESFLAYKKALEICKSHDIEYDRIPCYVKRK